LILRTVGIRYFTAFEPYYNNTTLGKTRQKKCYNLGRIYYLPNFYLSSKILVLSIAHGGPPFHTWNPSRI